MSSVSITGSPSITSFYEDQTFSASGRENDYSTGIEASANSVFYILVKLLSSAICAGFGLLLALSLASMVSVHWAVDLVGLLGSIGLAGTVWLSGNIVNK